MRKMVLAGIAALAMLGGGGAARAEPVDYGKGESWLCLPGRDDLCRQPLDATIVVADGTLTVEPFKPASDPGIDCFYVYPTVSTDLTGNSDMVVDPAERRVIQVQFARFTAVCRPFAPMYRQITVPALRAFMMGRPIPADREMAYADAKAAWNWYLTHENKGRGVVLIGHSQGAGVLTRLIAEEIDGKPAQKLLVSALIIGSNVPVKDGRFGSVPVCASDSQTGCLISYVSFRADVPPPATSRFGRVEQAGARAACTNPAALGGGKAVLDDVLTTGLASPWVAGQTVSTPFVKAPGLLSGECIQAGPFSYLAVTTNADPADPRTDRIGGDVPGLAGPDANWGLHLVDMNVAFGDLVRVVGAQAKAWKK